jgi:hypothetical protein
MSIYPRCPAYDQWFASQFGDADLDGTVSLGEVAHSIRPLIRLPGDIVVHETFGSIAARSYHLGCDDLGGGLSAAVTVMVWLAIIGSLMLWLPIRRWIGAPPETPPPERRVSPRRKRGRTAHSGRP